MIVLLNFAFWSNPPQSYGQSNSACAENANASRRTCDRETDGAFWRAVRTCVAVPAKESRQECIHIAGERRKQEKTDCVDRFKTELKSCDAEPKAHSGDPAGQYPRNPD